MSLRFPARDSSSIALFGTRMCGRTAGRNAAPESQPELLLSDANRRQTNGRSPDSRGFAESALHATGERRPTMAETDYTSVLNVIRSAKQQPVNSASRRAAIQEAERFL